MAKAETNILKRVMVAISSVSRVFRNNVGLFTTDNGDKIRTGLCKGSSDLIGWVPVEITPGMVGKKVAIFLGIEIKSSRGRASAGQLNFINQVRGAGGIAFITRSPEAASQELAKYIKEIQDARTDC
jgi:hypothetical protein